MRGDARQHELITAESLTGALAILAAEPGVWTPLAGGTELMVAHAAGRLAQQKLLSLGTLHELRFLRRQDASLAIGGGTTFGEVRRSALVAKEFPLLAQAAGWIGAITNQTRATLAGNIVNGSPAADAPPALLAYDAEIELISRRGSRRLPYRDFHLGYKRNVLAADELVYALHLPCRFAQHFSYQRKVGTRNAMAITKVGLAATAKVEAGQIVEIRLGAASLADRPLRLYQTESVLLGQKPSSALRQPARAALLAEAQPIDDIRSTAFYRKHVGANLIEEFLRKLEDYSIHHPSEGCAINPRLTAWNCIDEAAAIPALLSCCASERWAKMLAALRPFADEISLSEAADRCWAEMDVSDWMEAFRAHPRIGDRKPADASLQSKAWSSQEQEQVHAAQSAILQALAEGNRAYEEQFGFTYIVCATGKSAEEMLAILNRRLANDRATELREAAEQQREITQIRLKKWLAA
jgi:OHCU decarboxylase